ncbi:hypothetical protein SFRURICE_006829 [Spodoptera frugiperda]|nr:hypothetical protein SFRURICE_006829 [Spodoptera frugiperda]
MFVNAPTTQEKILVWGNTRNNKQQLLLAGIEPATRCAAASCLATAPTVQSMLRDVAASAHATHDEESLCDSKLVELFSINIRE